MEVSNPNQDLSKEDLALKNKLESYVNQLLQEPHNPALQKLAVERLKQEMIASYSISDSLIDDSKLQKFLRPHYNTLKHYFHMKMKDFDLKKLLADILSVMAMMSESQKRESLKYRLLGSQDDFTTWGLGYVKKLTIEVMEEYKASFQEDDTESSEEDDTVTSEEGNEENPENYENVLLNLVDQIVAFYMKNNLEIEAVDLVMEFERLEYKPLHKYVDQTNYKKTCLYITSLARFIHCDRGLSLLRTAYVIQLDFKQYGSALGIALFMEERSYVKQVLEHCDDLLQKKQLCFMVAQHGIRLRLDGKMVNDEQDRKELKDIINNLKLSQGYLDFARVLEVMEPKSPEDICKGRSCGARRQLGDAFVNAFVNAGFGKDNLMVGREKRVFKNKKEGKMSETASLGLIMLWQVDKGLKELQRHLQYNDDPFVKGGALLGVGILNSSVKHDSNPALKLLLDYVDDKDEHNSIRIGAIMGLGLSYANSKNKKVAQKLITTLEDHDTNLVFVAFAAISLGLVYMGPNNKRAADAIKCALRRHSRSIRALIDENPQGSALSERWMPFMRLICLGLSLLFLGGKKKVRQATDILGYLNKNLRKYCEFCLLSCAYVGSGDVLKVQSFLGNCDEEAAVLGIAMVAMGEESGLEMAVRSLEHLLQCGEQKIRKTVPLALSLLCISNPKRGNVVDVLSRLTHDCNSEVAMSAIISLGLVGSGTNNGRIAAMLRNLLRFYSSNDHALFCVQIALGLLHLGKGLLTLNPYHLDRFILSPGAIAGLVVFLHCCLDMRALMLEYYHLVLYFLVLAMKPRMLLTVDENLKTINVPVRVGQVVDVVGQAGRPRAITGFQTFETPVIVASGERAELCTHEYVALSPILEGFVILKHNPDYKETVNE